MMVLMMIFVMTMMMILIAMMMVLLMKMAVMAVMTVMTMIQNMIDIWHWSVWARADYQDDCEINLFRE